MLVGAREAFGYSHGEIAEVLDLTESNCQQIHRRAKQHLAADRRRVEVDAAAASKIVEEFLAAALSGRTDSLVRMLADDAIHVGDGGGVVFSLPLPITGALRVARFLRGLVEPSAAKAVTEIAEARPDLDVSLAARRGLGDWLGEKAKGHLRTALDRLGVTVHEHTDIVGVQPAGAVTADGHVLPALVTVWTGGFAVHPIAAATTLQVFATGQIVVDETMRSVSHPDVYAVGDAAFAPGASGSPLRMSCASGVPSAHLAADAIAARLTGRRLPQNKIGYLGQCISLGRHDAIVQWVTPDDQTKPSATTGKLAARLKEIICRSAAWSISHPTAMLPTRRRHTVLAEEPLAITA